MCTCWIMFDCICIASESGRHCYLTGFCFWYGKLYRWCIFIIITNDWSVSVLTSVCWICVHLLHCKNVVSDIISKVYFVYKELFIDWNCLPLNVHVCTITPHLRHVSPSFCLTWVMTLTPAIFAINQRLSSRLASQ